MRLYCCNKINLTLKLLGPTHENNLLPYRSTFTCFLIFGLSNTVALADTQRDVLAAQNQFGYKLFGTILKEKADDVENVFISPPSAFFMLSMVLEGAAGTTRRALLKGLQLDAQAHLEDIHSANHAYHRSLVQSDALILSLSNALWADVRFPLKKGFVDTVERYYSAKTANADFKENPSGTATDINNWAAEATNDLIPSIINEKTVRNLDMLIANAIYFKGTWQVAFDSKRTTDESNYFTMSNGTRMDSKVMRSDEVDYYTDLRGLQVARLPFKGETSSFYVILPPASSNAKKWVATHVVDDKFWNAVFKGMQRHKVNFEFPKFKFETSAELNDSLKTLGMGEIFSPRRA